MIEINNLSVKLAEQKILEDISLDIKENRITSILGESGSGKSVLLKTINAIFFPVAGSVKIDGIDIHKAKLKQRFELVKKMAVLFQGSALIDSLNVYQNIAFPLFEHTKLPEKEIVKKVKKSLEYVNLENIMEKYPSELSGGMKKRVSLARSIIMEPKYIFYDEPTTGLDPATSKKIINLIISLPQKIDLTSIVITHDKECIHKVSDYVAFIHQKKISFSGIYSDFCNSKLPELSNFL